MANKSIRMTQLKQLLIQKSQGISNKKIAQGLGISRATVISYMKSVKASGKNCEQLLKFTESELAEVIIPSGRQPEETSRMKQLTGRFADIDKELKRVGVTRHMLWLEYKEKHPEGYNYSQFCYHFRQWKNRQDVTMHFEHKAGDKMFIDFAGKKLELVDPETGEIIQVEVLVVILAASQYTYVEALESQKMEDFISGVENAFYYFKGVSKAIVPDNLKAAVKTPSRYEAELTNNFEEFANHYGTSVLAARPYKPRDKALVEGAVRIVYTRIYAPLRNENFHTLRELNGAIRALLESHNSASFQDRNQSRKDLFVEIEQPVLQPLPLERYDIKHYAWITVQKNSHVHLRCDRHYYSVPYRHIGKKVKLIYSHRQVEVFHNYQRLAFHVRDKTKFKYTTVPEHVPSTHRFVADWNPEKFIAWAQGIGPQTKLLIEAVLESKTHPEQAYKSCTGILAFARHCGKSRLENASKRALHFHSPSYRTIKTILEKGLDKQQEQPDLFTPLPEHDNLRGKQYYK